MNYDLAKKLKDKGFPQEGRGTYVVEKHTNVGMSTNTIPIFYFPTLSELIEECGDKFLSLSKEKHNELSYATSTSRPQERSVGKTLEEAVANLFLKIHENN